MNRIDYYRPVLLGFIVGMVFLTGIYVFLSPVENVKPAEALDDKGTFTVVSQYKGCDIIRWTQSNFAEYKYFLHCDK